MSTFPLIPLYSPVPLKSVTGAVPAKRNEHVALLKIGCAWFVFAFSTVELTSKVPLCSLILT